MSGDLRELFTGEQLSELSRSVTMAEELVSDYYKMSAHQWLSFRFDVKTRKDLGAGEVVSGPYAQVVRYVGRGEDRHLSSSSFDYYKICIQDGAVLSVLKENPDLLFFPFILYVTVHELVHVVRFGRFLQCFVASEKVRVEEEMRVHRQTFAILHGRNVEGLAEVLSFHGRWHGF